MKRMLMLAAVAALGTIGCKSTDADRPMPNSMPMLGANGKAATADGKVVQTSYRPGAGGVQQAGGTGAAPGTVVPAGGAVNANCPTGTCANGTCPTTGMPMTYPAGR